MQQAGVVTRYPGRLQLLQVSLMHPGTNSLCWHAQLLHLHKIRGMHQDQNKIRGSITRPLPSASICYTAYCIGHGPRCGLIA